ncbi:2-oxo acid dehydrogenase subunit E2 [Nocardia amamiensis]|uniref:2-oxo acid dehydrogenase subunit E2 n=1 Tax=Nocardia amamiensis TaxID=404578 RepID=UPI00083491EF|nr:2-oxo acid dehydrogenase subunit E2 [Nocardia amamiensis]
MREVPLVMPKMSMTMTEGTFIVWHKAAGDVVTSGDVVCEVASDKVDMEVESPLGGTLARLVAEPDQVIAVGEPLAFIATDADDMLEGLFDVGAAPDAADAGTAADAARANDAPTGAPLLATPPSRRGPRPAVPRARRRASELRVDIDTVTGTGPDGLITVADVEAAESGTPAPAAQVPAMTVATSAPAPAGSRGFERFGEVELSPLSRISRISGPALANSWVTIPHVTQHDVADITDLEVFRRELDTDAKREGYRVTLLAFVLKAVVSALQEYPRVNSSLSGDGKSLVLKKYYHLGVAVDTDQGLVVPVVRDVDRKGISALSRELGAISERARSGKLTGDDVTGATFTVSSLGGIGGTAFTPIVNSPEAAILGVSRSRIEPAWDGETFQPRLQLPISLSYDHRIIDGALGARFATRVASLLGDVRRLIL